MSDILDKKYTDFKTKDELINFIKTKKDKLNIDLSGYEKKETDDKECKTIFKQC